MRGLHRIGTATLLTLFAANPAQGQSGEGSLDITATVGVQNQPGGFDVSRTVDYKPGMLIGGGAILRLFPRFAIRADVSYAMSSGQQSGAVGESVDLNRAYYGASMELRFPTELGLAPYAFAGGGLVNLRRTASSYNFQLTESAALLGAGIAYAFDNTPFTAFVQLNEWIYNRTSAGGTQFDTSFGVGLGYAVSR